MTRKAYRALALLATAATVAGCASTTATRLQTTRVVTIVQVTDDQFSLTVSERIEKGQTRNARHRTHDEGTTEFRNYPTVVATVGGAPGRTDVRDMLDNVVLGLSLEVFDEANTLYATYEIREVRDDGRTEIVSQTLKLK